MIASENLVLLSVLNIVSSSVMLSFIAVVMQAAFDDLQLDGMSVPMCEMGVDRPLYGF